ncbi:MAG: hypothetical protein M3O28_11890 [Actinomycetota bacterium]|nr:hypothetical protein [Actinomycetota bacterium]
MAATVASPSVQKADAGPSRVARARAALADQQYRLVQLILFAMGAVLMPLGLIAIALGWYGTAHSHYDYDQRTYLISGGVLGLGLCFVGGFLYFGALLAKANADQRDSQLRLAESLNHIAALMSAPLASPTHAGGSIDQPDGLVFAGQGSTLHRRDCPLISQRPDLIAASGREANTTVCRVCHPTTN